MNIVPITVWFFKINFSKMVNNGLTKISERAYRILPHMYKNYIEAQRSEIGD